MKNIKGISTSGVTIAAIAAAAVAVGAIVILRSDIFGSKGSGLGEQFTYDISELEKIDPALVGYRQVASIPVRFSAARGIAVGADGRIYVAGDTSIHVHGPEGRKPFEIALDGPPQALVATEGGLLYVAMKDHVELYEQSGKRVARWASLGEKARLTSITATKADVLVADAGNRVVLRYDLRGNLVKRIGKKDSARNIPGLVAPSPFLEVAVAGDGLLRVNNPGRLRVEAYTLDGDLEFWWGRASPKIDGFCGCCNPTHLAILPDGSVVTSEKGLPRVKVYDSDGKFACVVAGPKSFAQGITGLDLAVDSDGRILVLDPAAKQVRIFAKKKPLTKDNERD